MQYHCEGVGRTWSQAFQGREMVRLNSQGHSITDDKRIFSKWSIIYYSYRCSKT